MENRARQWKPGDFSLGQVHEFAGAFGRAGGNPELLQKAIEEQKVMSQVVELLGRKLEKVMPFAGEQIESSYGYPDGFRIRSAQEQVEILLKFFPSLDASHVQELASGELPEWAEGWAVIPKTEKVGKTYDKALEAVLGLIAKERKFKNWPEGALTEKHLRLKEKTAQAHAKLNEQPGDFWVFPFQFGKKWRGYSVYKSQARFEEREFGLGLYEAAILLLTHPDRIINPAQLNIDCAGCECGGSGACLHFCWDGSYGRLALHYYGTDDVFDQWDWGTVSGFLAQ